MKNFKLSFAVTCAILVLSVSNVSGQSTYGTVYNLLQSKCSSCHGGASAIAFSVDGSQNDMFTALVNEFPDNQTALDKGNKLVDPGHPYNSFLLRKIGYQFDNYFNLEPTETDNNHTGIVQIHEMELIRQWILAGCEKTGTVVSYQLLQDYYANGGLDFLPVPTAPALSEGIQVRYGPVFLAAQDEMEIMKKERLPIKQDVEITKLGGYMAWQSHHMLLFKNTNSNYNDGTRQVPVEDAPFNNGELVVGWQDEGDFPLPAGTAFFWNAGTVLDFDYHIKNYDQTKIMPADFYLNIYYQPRGTGAIEMKAELVNNFALFLPQGNQTVSSPHIPGGNGKRFIYMITGHTHKYGNDFDIYLRNQNGSKGEQVYEGFYNAEYTFNQGYFSWEHPAIRIFEDLKEFDPNMGLIYETKWNVQQSFVTFGLTTNEEMMLMTYLYTEEKVTAPTAIIESEVETAGLVLYPNPFKDAVNITYSLTEKSEVKLEVFDIVGKNIATLVEGMQDSGDFNRSFEPANALSGVYFVKLSINGNVVTKKIVEME